MFENSIQDRHCNIAQDGIVAKTIRFFWGGTDKVTPLFNHFHSTAHDHSFLGVG